MSDGSGVLSACSQSSGGGGSPDLTASDSRGQGVTGRGAVLCRLLRCGPLYENVTGTFHKLLEMSSVAVDQTAAGRNKW